MPEITPQLTLTMLIATHIPALIIYLTKSKSYSNSYITAALKRRNKEVNLLNTAMLLLIDRSLAALLIYRLNNRINNALIGRIITNIGFLLTGVEIYFNAKIGYRVQIWHGQGTVIGQNAVIGNDCLILHQVTLGSGFVVLGERIKVGAGAKILGSIYISDDCIIGANAVITEDLPPKTLATTQIQISQIENIKKISFGTKHKTPKN